jgi:hypothetical protein
MKKSFNEIYQDVYKSANASLMVLKKKRDFWIIMFIICLGGMIGLFANETYNFALLAVVLITVITAIVAVKANSDYRKAFKTLVIEKLIASYDPNFRFNAVGGISSHDYRAAGFDGHYDHYYTEDLIVGSIDGKQPFRMSQVTTTKEVTVTDNEGHTRTETRTLFKGLFGIVELKDYINVETSIFPNNMLKKYSQNRIEVDSAEFEKIYDMFSLDKVRTMEVFTSEVIEKFNKFHEDTKYAMQMKVEFNKIYFRIPCGDAFEAPAFKQALSFDYVYKNYQMIEFPIELISKIIENALETLK